MATQTSNTTGTPTTARGRKLTPVPEPPVPAKPRSRKPTRTRPAPPQAPPQALSRVEQVISHMPEQYVQCRDWGHSWRPFSARWLSNENYFEQILRCGRCESERTRQLGPRGQRLESNYTYAAGYLMEPGHGRMDMADRDAVRLASLRSVLTQDLVQE